MGKAYANRLAAEDRPEGDFYETPRSLIWVAKDIIDQEFPRTGSILEPCSGNLAIVKELVKLKYIVQYSDLYRGGKDYLTSRYTNKYVITNPPFSQWDEFVMKAKSHASKVMMIGRLNYFGTASRMSSGIWHKLKSVHCFNRYVDYRTPPREDGLFHVGAMATAWFIWDNDFIGHPTIHFLDVQPYAKLGNLK